MGLYRKLGLFVQTRLRNRSRQAESYKAVTVAATARCCDAARATQSKPILVSYLPRLPLPGCTMPDRCRCEFLEWPDRRIGERRLTSPGTDATGVQRRISVDRRKAKPKRPDH
jgi:hypothetical protein